MLIERWCFVVWKKKAQVTRLYLLSLHTSCNRWIKKPLQWAGTWTKLTENYLCLNKSQHWLLLSSHCWFYIFQCNGTSLLSWALSLDCIGCKIDMRSLPTQWAKIIVIQLENLRWQAWLITKTTSTDASSTLDRSVKCHNFSAVGCYVIYFYKMHIVSIGKAKITHKVHDL